MLLAARGATSDGGKYLAYICQPKKVRRGKHEALDICVSSV